MAAKYADRNIGFISTGRFFDWETPENNEFLVSIANSIPVKFIADHNWKLVNPGRIVWDYKNGFLTKEAYISAYLRLLEQRKDAIASELADIRKLAQGKTVVLLCWEPEGQFCHRHLLLDFLQSIGVLDGNNS
jgi:uncharacterized protein (DUF488 family)